MDILKRIVGGLLVIYPYFQAKYHLPDIGQLGDLICQITGVCVVHQAAPFKKK